MTHGPMITFRFNGLSAVPWMAGRYVPVRGRIGVEGVRERREGEGMHIEHGSGESKRAARGR